MSQYLHCQLALALLLLGSGQLLTADAPGDTRHREWSGEFEDDWMSQWHVREKPSWGLHNLKVVSDADCKFRKILRVTYPKESASFTAAKHYGVPLGGAQFEADLGLRPSD